MPIVGLLVTSIILLGVVAFIFKCPTIGGVLIGIAFAIAYMAISNKLK
jgi:hypothetical protein